MKQLLVGLDRGTFALFDPFAAFQRQAERHPEKLFEDQPDVRRAAHTVVIVKRNLIRGKMRFAEGFYTRNQFAACKQVTRQGFFDLVLRQACQQFVDDLAQAL